MARSTPAHPEAPKAFLPHPTQPVYTTPLSQSVVLMPVTRFHYGRYKKNNRLANCINRSMRRCRWLMNKWKAAGFTLAQLARSSGISRRTLERIAQTGSTYQPSARTLLKLAGPLRLGVPAVLMLLTHTEVDPAALDALEAMPDGLAGQGSEVVETIIARLEILESEVGRLAALVDGIVKRKA